MPKIAMSEHQVPLAANINRLSHLAMGYSDHPKVSWDFSNPEHLVLLVRVACPIGQRANVEQAVFRALWRAISPAWNQRK
jgi:hypothetical protein